MLEKMTPGNDMSFPVHLKKKKYKRGYVIDFLPCARTMQSIGKCCGRLDPSPRKNSIDMYRVYVQSYASDVVLSTSLQPTRDFLHALVVQLPLISILRKIDVLVLVVLIAHHAPHCTLHPHLGAAIPADSFSPPLFCERAGYRDVLIFGAVLVTAG